MRKILVLIMFLILTYPVNGASEIRHEIYSKANFSDEGIYIYFSKIIEDARKCLDKFLDEDPDAVNFSTSLEHKVKLTEEESKFYAAKGIESNVSLVIKPFITLSTEIKKLTHFQPIFLENIEFLFQNQNNSLAYINARIALMNMKLAADGINSSIDEIERIELRNETSGLHFDTSEFRSRLGDVYDLIAYYESLLARFEFEKESLLMAISEDHPILYQEVKIFVYAKNVTPTALFIDGVERKINGSIMNYRFEEPGEHVIRVEGSSNGKTVKPSVVKVYVRKIPTYIVLYSKSAAFISENVTVTGFLSDYYGNPLNANITIKVDSSSFQLMTHRGFFSFNVTRSSEGFVNIWAFYAGNETYESSEATTSIFFSRFPTSLYIEADKKRIRINETVNFTGRIDGVRGAVPIHVFVNSTDVMRLNTTGEFNFTLNFTKSGTYSVYAHFPGNSLYRPAESNRVEIVVELSSSAQAYDSGYPKSIKVTQERVNARLKEKGQKIVSVTAGGVPLYWLVIPILAGAIVVSALYLRYSRKGEKVGIEETVVIDNEAEIAEPEKVEEVRKPEAIEDKKLELPKSVSDAYNSLFTAAITKYNLKKSLTPRELLKTLESEPFAGKLKAVTHLHEIAVYGLVKLGGEEMGTYYRLIDEILDELKEQEEQEELK